MLRKKAVQKEIFKEKTPKIILINIFLVQIENLYNGVGKDEKQ
jgi:hypothetical protein